VEKKHTLYALEGIMEKWEKNWYEQQQFGQDDDWDEDKVLSEDEKEELAKANREARWARKASKEYWDRLWDGE
jgi:tRNA(Glu) U13 pseudouridine synthase TruD